MDKIYALPYARAAHPRYREPIPADEMLRTSITSHRGCGGGCSFCSLALHQGRRISSRSQESLLAEARTLVAQSNRLAGMENVTVEQLMAITDGDINEARSGDEKLNEALKKEQELIDSTQKLIDDLQQIAPGE